MKRLLFCLFSLMVLTVNGSFAEERDNGTETPPSTYTDNQGIIYRLNSAGNAYTVTGHTSDFNVNVNLPSSLYGIPVTSIGFNAFHGCRISSIFIPSTVKNLYDGMEDNPFSACVNLTSITVASDNPWYDSREGCNAIIEKSSNSLIIGCSKSFIPNSVESIGRDAFYGSTFSDITIPENIKSIGSISFGRCNELKSFIVKISTPFSIDENVFDESNHNVFEYATLYVPKGCKTAYQQANVWKNFQNIVEQEEVNPENYESYAVYQNGVLTFYYDNKKSTREGTVYGLNEGYEIPGWYNEHRTEITKAVFDDSFAGARPTSTYYWFAGGYDDPSNLTEIQDIQNLNTSNVTYMDAMFSRCSSLTSLDVSHFDTGNVTNMGSMFYCCSSLTSLDLSHFDTGNVTAMYNMFYGCSGLSSLDVSHFDTSNVINMRCMFYGCSGLSSLDLSHFDTGKVKDMASMFAYCSNLSSLDLSHFDTRNVTSFDNMFGGCNGLTSLDLSHFDTSKATSMSSMFSGCTNLKSLDLSNFNTSKVKSMGYIFSNCSNLRSLDLSHFNTGNVTRMESMFSDCSFLKSLDLSNFNTSNVTNMKNMFRYCSNLTSLDLSHFNTENVTDMSYMFFNCRKLTSLDISHFDTGKVTDMNNMFSYCSSLTSLDVSHFDTKNVTTMHSMFWDCGSLTSLDVSHFNTENVTTMVQMFWGCNSLTSLDLSHFDIGNVTNMSSMFAFCRNLNSIDLSGFNTSHVTDMGQLFLNCGSLTSLDLGSFDTANVTNLGAMFRGCSSLTSLDLSHFNTEKVTNTQYMFCDCPNLSTIYCDDTWSSVYSTQMFYNCKSLPAYNEANITVDYAKPIDLGGYFTRVENNPNGIIDFADAEVKRICVENWDTNGDGELSYGEAAAVTDLGQVFKNNRNIKSFDELQHFAGIKEICDSAFYSNRLLYSITLPKQIKRIGKYAFYYDRNLQTINFPEGVKEIDIDAFWACYALKNIKFPTTLNSFEAGSFYGIEKVESIQVEDGNLKYDSRNNCNAVIETSTNTLVLGCQNTIIPYGITSIGDDAFSGCKYLEEITIPNTVNAIGRSGFYACSKLESIIIPASVKSIGYYSFKFCYGLSSMIVEEGNSTYDSRDNCNAIIETKTNTLLFGCKKTVIPSTVNIIGSQAFYSLDSLKEIRIPKSVTKIGAYAFRGCDSLMTIYMEGKTPPTLAGRVFEKAVWLQEDSIYHHAVLYVPFGTKEIYQNADGWKMFKNIIEMDGENSLYADDVTVRPGVQKTVALQLDNENTFVAGEFRLQLPAGMRIETDEDGEPVANLVSGRSNKHTLMVTDEGNGLYHFMFYSGQNRAILGNSGDFISLSVIADESVEDGSYTAKLKNVFFSTEDEKRIDLPDVDFNIVVLDYTPGDVNGDGSLNVMDVVKLVNYIMGRNPSDFVFVAADMDENGKINVMDLVNVVEVIMAAPQQAPVMGMATSSNLELDRTSKNTVSLSVPDADRHIAAQFTVTLSGNAVLKDVLSDDAHQSEVTRMSDGSYKVMVYSGRNDSFKSNNPISLQLSGNSDVKIDDVVFVNADEEAVAYEPVMTNTTGIMAAESDFSQPTDIYTVNGSLVKKGATSMRGLASGVYIVNNEKVVIK